VQIGPRVAGDQWPAWYKTRLAALGPGVYQLTLHLGYDDDEARGATGTRPWGAAWRQRDFDFFTSPEFRQLLAAQNIKLITWREITSAAKK
jgi:chitin disaccharide deacetylase